MKLKDNHIVLTDGTYEGEKVHKYISLDDGREFVGITGKELLGTLFPLNVPENRMHYVYAAAERGHAIHDALENYLRDGVLAGTNLNHFIEEYKKLALKESVAQEYTVQWGKFASNIDNVWQENQRGVSLVDYKSWKTKDEHNLIKCMWQLNIYKYMFEDNNPTIKVKHLYCMWLPSDMVESAKQGELIELPLIDKEIIAKLMDDANEGRELSIPDIPIGGIDVVGQRGLITQEQIDAIADIKVAYDEVTKKHKELTDILKMAMKEYGVKSIDNNRFKATFSITQKKVFNEESLKERFPERYKDYQIKFDEDKFKQAYPQLYAEYMTLFDEEAFKAQCPDTYDECCDKVDGAERLNITLKKNK